MEPETGLNPWEELPELGEDMEWVEVQIGNDLRLIQRPKNRKKESGSSMSMRTAGMMPYGYNLKPSSFMSYG